MKNCKLSVEEVEMRRNGITVLHSRPNGALVETLPRESGKYFLGIGNRLPLVRATLSVDAIADSAVLIAETLHEAIQP